MAEAHKVGVGFCIEIGDPNDVTGQIRMECVLTTGRASRPTAKSPEPVLYQAPLCLAFSPELRS